MKIPELWQKMGNCGSNRGLWEKHRTVSKARGCGRGWRIVGTAKDWGEKGQLWVRGNGARTRVL